MLNWKVSSFLNLVHLFNQNTLELLPGYLQSQLGDGMDSDANAGWTKVLKNFKMVMENKISELDKQQ